VLGYDGGDAEVADQARFLEVGHGAEVLGDRAEREAPAQIDDVEVVAAELPDVLLDLSA
jgi:hypothetical protein